MAANTPLCSVCGVKFELHFRYQVEDHVDPQAGGGERRLHFCSQRCLEASHRERADGQVSCEACARRFEVEYAAQVLFTGGRRHYACNAVCRSRVLEGVRAVRLGQLMDPGYPLAEENAAREGERAPEAELPMTATPPPLPMRATPPPLPMRATPPPLPMTATPPPLPMTATPPPLPMRATPPPLPMTATPPPLAVAEAVSLSPKPRNANASAPGRPERPRGRTPRVLAVFNHKGGTGKTTTSVHMAAGLAASGKRVLLVDTDGQGNVATSLGLKFERSLYHVIVMGLDYREVVIEARPGLDVVPANETLAAAELYLAGQRQRDRLLANRFQTAKAAYDFVVVDCSPSLSLMNQNALVMADAVLCPVACDYLSLVGIQKVVRTVKNINRLLSHPLTFWGVLPTFFDTRARICHEALDTLRGHFHEVCLPPIRLASRVKEAPSQGKTLFEYAPGSSATLDYQRVVDRLLDEAASEEAPTTSLEGVA